MPTTNKSQRRTEIVKTIMEVMKSPKIFDTIKYQQKSEEYIKQYMHQPMMNEIVELFKRDKGLIHETAVERARTALKWEGDKQTVVNNFMFLGVQHRPDFVLDYDDISIAIEVKRGDNGTSVREGLGQSVVYNTNFDFSVYLFIDTSKDGRIKNSFTGEKEQEVVKSLWDNHNTLFEVV
jgi:hypothetical protein